MTILLDTMVVSEFGKRKPDTRVLAWLDKIPPSELYLSTITLAEIERGIERLRPTDTRRAEALDLWLEATLRRYRDRILPLDAGAARRWGRLAARLGNAGLDLAIASIALENGMTVATRNIDHFRPTGVAVINPFAPT